MRWLIRLYPSRWRERYEEEMLAVLEEHTVTTATVLDLLMGALDAHLNYDGFPEGVTYMVNRLRSSIIAIFCAFMLYGVGWSLLQRINDPVATFHSASELHPELTVLHQAIFIVGSVAFLAFLMGGVPLFFIAVKRAFTARKPDVLMPFWMSVACLILFVLATAALAMWHPQTHTYAVLMAYLILTALLLLVGSIAVSLVLARANFQLSDLKLVFVPETVIVFGMVVSVVLSTTLLILITVYAPQLFYTQDVSTPMFITGLVFMALGTIFASMGLRRGIIKGLHTLGHDAT
ncbi:MAG: hypothetical protein K6T63_04915 [Alicyclobacillus herbarius]|uniref:hypothetical protein n=1 Tax=Alicyclobacillus herbarius TaxID=122960 RepID=UPI0023557523|nr:hypothetical protein [Alicyclobacillus herbarius]MCL6631956.1 hypothetical protein [Alicyclobacillus herbarius]